MNKNMGTLDRALRTIMAVVIGYLVYNGTIIGALGMVLAAIAVVFLLTSLFSVCPLYSVVGLSTCPRK